MAIGPSVLIPASVLIIGVLLVLGTPLAYALIIGASVPLFFYFDFSEAMTLITGTSHETVSDFTLSAVPMFLLMAEFLSVSGLAKDVFEAANTWFGQFRGGLPIALTFANGMFAALSGSSTASAATMSRISLPEMRKYDYDDRVSMGTVSAAGTFAIMFPPSLGLIIYGVLTLNNIGRLFIAGIVPGILTLVAYVFVIVAWGQWNPSAMGGSTQSYPLKEKIASSAKVWPGLILIVIVLGGLYGGVMTASESGAVGASGAFLVSLLIYRISFDQFRESLTNAVQTTAKIFIIVYGAVLFGYFLAVTRTVQALVEFISALPVTPFMILLLLILVYIVLGTFMDQLAILILTLPLTYPLMVDGFGYNPIWFGVVIVKTIEIGLVTPPFGLNVFIASSTVDVEPEVGFRGASRFLLADLVILAILLVFPSVVLWLPGMM